jgi:HEAT repeat protein
MSRALNDPKLTNAAVQSLAQIGSKQAVEALAAHYQQADAKGRVKVIEQISYDPGGQAHRLLERALADRDEEVVAAAAGALARGGADDQLRGQLVAMLQASSSQKKVRFQIANGFRSSSPAVYRQYKQLIDSLIKEGI